MNTDDRLNLRARQMLDDPTLSSRDRIANPDALIKQLALSVKDDPARLASVLAEITDTDVREQMRAAIAAVIV